MPMTTQQKIKPQRQKVQKKKKKIKTDIQQKPAHTNQDDLDNQQPGQKLVTFEKFSILFAEQDKSENEERC